MYSLIKQQAAVAVVFLVFFLIGVFVSSMTLAVVDNERSLVARYINTNYEKSELFTIKESYKGVRHDVPAPAKVKSAKKPVQPKVPVKKGDAVKIKKGSAEIDLDPMKAGVGRAS
jgi:hypothetical protein